jgi:hypothetical protein
MQVFLIWFIVRILTSLAALLASPLRKLTDLERTVSVWPPSGSISTWLIRLILSPLERWDVHWYIRIVVNGYGPGDGSTQFHPLYPLAASALYKLGVSPLLSLVLVSSIASLLLFFFFYRLALLDLSQKDALTSLLLFAIFPTSFILFAPYSEALFLLCAVACFYWARQRMWWLAGLAGAFAVLTRQQGVLLIFPLIWEYLSECNFEWKNCLQSWKQWLSLIMIPLALFGWIIYRSVLLSDVQPDLTNFNSFIYSVLISPHADKVVPQQAFLPPWQVIGRIVEKTVMAPDPDILVNILGSLIFIAILIAAWPHMRMSYRIYCLIIYLVSLSYYTGSVHPAMGLLRHLMLAFPIYLSLPLIIRKPLLRLSWATVSGLALCFLVFLYVLESWVV